ncbi:MAG: GNAT family N-acetyltransferase [Pikeienuella sp.]
MTGVAAGASLLRMDHAAFEIREARESDLEPLRAIVNREIRETTATWTSVERTAEAMRDWREGLRRDGHPALVAAEPGGAPLGYASCGRFRAWPGYRLAAESSVYVARGAQRRGIGRALLTALAAEARAAGLVALVAVIGADRDASLALHLACGWREAGRLPGIGEKFGRRLDMVILQKSLEP